MQLKNIDDDQAYWAYNGAQLARFGQSRSEVRQALENAGLTVVENLSEDLVAMKGQVIGACFMFDSSDKLTRIGFYESGDPAYYMNRYDYEAEE